MTISHDDLKAILNDLVDRGVVALTLPNGERIELGQRARDSAPPAPGDSEWLTREQLRTCEVEGMRDEAYAPIIRMALAAIDLRDQVQHRQDSMERAWAEAGRAGKDAMEQRARVAELEAKLKASLRLSPPVVAEGYPNLDAALRGCVSGSPSEWPAIRGEIYKLAARAAAGQKEGQGNG